MIENNNVTNNINNKNTVKYNKKMRLNIKAQEYQNLTAV